MSTLAVHALSFSSPLLGLGDLRGDRRWTLTFARRATLNDVVGRSNGFISMTEDTFSWASPGEHGSGSGFMPISRDVATYATRLFATDSGRYPGILKTWKAAALLATINVGSTADVANYPIDGGFLA